MININMNGTVKLTKITVHISKTRKILDDSSTVIAWLFGLIRDNRLDLVSIS